MRIQTDFSLRPYNTFGLDVHAGHFASFSSADELQELLAVKPFIATPPVILGGGSNILFTKDPPAVLKNEIKGIAKAGEDNDHIYVKVGAGESWHGFVQYSVQKKMGGY